MPRKGPAPKPPVIADPVYGSPLVTNLVNKVLLSGKRSLAQKIVYGALAALPLFLIWIYVCWIILLVGAAVAATLAEHRWGRSRKRRLR